MEVRHYLSPFSHCKIGRYDIILLISMKIALFHAVIHERMSTAGTESYTFLLTRIFIVGLDVRNGTVVPFSHLIYMVVVIKFKLIYCINSKLLNTALI